MEKKLLIVDDQPAMSDAVRRVAEGLDYEVLVTNHANEFMKLYDDFAPDLVVLDIIMPDMDGIELLKWMSGREMCAKVIVASGYNPQYAKMAETLGKLNGLDIVLIDKPFRISEMRDALTG